MHVVVVGAGPCGLGTALRLSELGHKVTVFESKGIPGGASLQSSGLLWAYPGNDPSKWNSWFQLFFGRSLEHFARLDKMGSGINFVNQPVHMAIHTEQQFQTALKHHVDNASVQVLRIEEARKLEPNLDPNLVGSVYWDWGGHGDMAETATKTIELAQDLGAKFIFTTEVTSLRRDKKTGRIRVKTVHKMNRRKRSQLEADAVCICAGYNSAKLCQMLKVEVPVFAVSGQMFAVKHPSLKINSILTSYESKGTWFTKQNQPPNTTHAHHGAKPYTRHLYGRQLTNGTFAFGGARICGTLPVVESVHEGVFEHACEILPRLREGKLIGKWVGYMPWTPDALPIFDRLESNNAFVMTGCTSHGYSTGYGAGACLAEYLDTNRLHPLLKGITLKRFSGHDSGIYTPKPAL